MTPTTDATTFHVPLTVREEFTQRAQDADNERASDRLRVAFAITAFVLTGAAVTLSSVAADYAYENWAREADSEFLYRPELIQQIWNGAAATAGLSLGTTVAAGATELICRISNVFKAQTKELTLITAAATFWPLVIAGYGCYNVSTLCRDSNRV